MEDRTLLSSFTVTTTADGVPGSLRQLIQAANSNPGADTIVVPANTYTLTIAGTGEDAAATGDLDITDDLTVTGDGAQTTLINGGALDNVFQVIGNVAANFSGLTIRNAGGGTSAGVGILGGQATLHVTACSLTDNPVADIKTASGSVTVASSTVNGASKTSQGILSTSGGNITVTDGKFRGNSVGINSRGGTVMITDSTLSNNFDGLTSLETATITNSILSDNSGDGIDGSTNLTITGSTLSNNSGDGIDGNHTLRLTNSTISGNGNDGIDGTDTLTMTNSTLSGNGGDAIDGGITVTMTNSTLSSNGRDGINGGTVTLIFVTIANNNGIGLNGSVGTIGNSIVAFNGTNGVLRTLTSQGHNISSDGSLASSFTQPGDLNNTDPKIGPLADNGGTTFTHALLAGSPALDDANGTGAPATDQRGIARPQGAGFDIGAFEVQVVTTTVIPPPATPVDTTGPTVVALERFGFHARPTRLVLTFSEALDPARAIDLADYRLTGPCGRVIRIRSATYNAAARTVTLRPTRLLDLHHTFHVVVNGTTRHGVADRAGNAMDGDRDGRPGGAFRGRITRATLAEVPGGPAQVARASFRRHRKAL
jgi:hypothetical protein